jgi:hypothetical protein
MGFTPLRIYLRAPIERVIKSGRSRHGIVSRELTDDDVQAVPVELREELAQHVREAESWRGEDYGDPPCLDLDEPEDSIDAIIAALRRDHAERRALAAKEWLDVPDVSWTEVVFGKDVIRDEILAFSDVPAVALRVEQINGHLQELEAASEAATEGLREYAQSLPEYRRGAQQGYDVSDVAVDAFVKAIAAVDEDAFIYRSDSEEFRRSQLHERRAPEEYAFVVLDRVTKHLEKLPKPRGVGVEVGRIVRFRQAVRDGAKWKLSVPITVVPIRIDPQVTAARVVLVFADAEEKATYVGDKQNDGDDIPF